MTKYRDEIGREIYVARTYWGPGKYCTFYRDDLEHRLVDPALPPRQEIHCAQADLDKFAKKYLWKKIED